MLTPCSSECGCRKMDSEHPGFCVGGRERYLLTRRHEDALPSGKVALSNRGSLGLIRELAQGTTSSCLRVRIKLTALAYAKPQLSASADMPPSFMDVE